jgi:hypothetical protein
MTVAERLENLEGCVSRLVTRVDQLEATIANIQAFSPTINPYSGNAFQSPFGKPFRYSVVPQECDKRVNDIQNTNDIQSSSIIIQKLEKLLDVLNNNFSRLDWRLEALENQRKE